MSWRSIYISNSSKLAIKNSQLSIISLDDDRKITVPIEDIASIVLESRKSVITTRLLSECAENGIGVITIGENHHPNGVLCPFASHSRSLKIMRLQIELSIPKQKRLWQAIIKRKISNQASCLKLLGLNGGSKLEHMSKLVKSGDSGKLEAPAARVYFKELFGKDFKRKSLCWTNSAMNYGYAIIRATIARNLASYGFIPALGVGHNNEQNPFNLADDWLEVYRPFIDFHVAQRKTADNEELTTNDKTWLVSLLGEDIEIGNGARSLYSAIKLTIQGHSRYLATGSVKDLMLPVVQNIRSGADE